MRIAGLRKWWDLIKESKIFIKGKTKVACRMTGIEWRVVYFRKLLFKTNNEKFSLGRVKSKKICRHPGRDLFQSSLEVGDTWVSCEDGTRSIICVKVMVKRKWGDESAEWGRVESVLIHNTMWMSRYNENNVVTCMCFCPVRDKNPNDTVLTRHYCTLFRYMFRWV